MQQVSTATGTYPWDSDTLIGTGLQSPLSADAWVWRTISPRHPAILGLPRILRRSDPGDAFEVIAERYGEPASYCVLGRNLAFASTWEGVPYAEQYRAVTAGAGAFPSGGMYYLSVVGPHAVQVLNLLTPRCIDLLEVDQAVFTVFTTTEGAVDTEGVILRDGEQSYQVSFGGHARPPTWLHDAIDMYPDTHAEEASLSSFNLKGPRAMPAMAQLVADEFAATLDHLKPFRVARVRTRWGDDARIVRTVIGVEMWATPEVIRTAWQTMMADPDVYTPCGWDVLTSFRLEYQRLAFYLCPLDIHHGTFLLDAGLAHLVSRDKRGSFVGREALLKPSGGGRMWVAGLIAADPDAPQQQIGAAIVNEESGQPDGFVTSAGYSPREGRQLCFAHLDTRVRPSDILRFADGTTWRVTTVPIPPPQ